jgi:shikimate kinase
VVGQALARRLRRRFVDLDSEIERIAGLTVAEIFSRFGEREFRSREREAIETVSGLKAAVVATGGGAVVDPRSRALMRAAGRIVCLSAEPEVILARLARLGPGADRPLLADAAGRAERVRSLLAERAAAYADTDFKIDTSRRSPTEVVEAITEWLAGRPPIERTDEKAPVG